MKHRNAAFALSLLVLPCFLLALLYPRHTAQADVTPLVAPYFRVWFENNLEPLGIPKEAFAGEENRSLRTDWLQSIVSDTIEEQIDPAEAQREIDLHNRAVSLASLVTPISDRTQTFEDRSALAQEIIRGIQPGMTRADLNKIFTESDGGINLPNHWQYYFGAQVTVVVPFDDTGGSLSPENRVNGVPFLIKSWAIMD